MASNRTSPDNRLPSDKAAVICPQVSIGLLHELGANTDYRSWSSINELLDLGEDGHKAVRGQKPDRRNGYPRGFTKDTYLDALNTIASSYTYATDLINRTHDYLEANGVRLPEIDGVLEEMRTASFPEKNAPLEANARENPWWRIVTDAICFHFAYDNDARPAKAVPPSSTRAPLDAARTARPPARDAADAPAALEAQAGTDTQAASDDPATQSASNGPALLGLVKALLWEKDIVFGPAPTDEEFARRLLPKGFVPYLEKRLGTHPAALVSQRQPASFAHEAFRYFTADGGLRCRHLVERCGTLLADGATPLFFASVDDLFEALEGSTACPRDMHEVRSAFLRFADGSAARGLAFLTVLSLVNDCRMAVRIVGQPQVAGC